MNPNETIYEIVYTSHDALFDAFHADDDAARGRRAIRRLGREAAVQATFVTVLDVDDGVDLGRAGAPSSAESSSAANSPYGV